MTLELLLSMQGSVMTKHHRSFLPFPPSYLPNMPSYLFQCSSPFCNLPLSLRFPTHECSVRPAHWPKFDSGMNSAGITKIPVPSSTHHHKRRKSKPLCPSIYIVFLQTEAGGCLFLPANPNLHYFCFDKHDDADNLCYYYCYFSLL